MAFEPENVFEKATFEIDTHVSLKGTLLRNTLRFVVPVSELISCYFAFVSIKCI